MRRTVIIELLQKEAARQYTVTFMDGSQTLKTMQVVKNNNWTIPSLEKEGHTLEGVYTDSTFNTKVTTINVNQDIVLYTKWNINTYTVNFDTDGGSSINSQTVPWGGKATRPVDDPTKADSKLEDWYAEPSKSTIFNFNTVVIKKNTTIYAKWVTINTSEAVSNTPKEKASTRSNKVN